MGTHIIAYDSDEEFTPINVLRKRRAAAAKAAALVARQNRKATAKARQKIRERLAQLGGVYEELCNGLLPTLLHPPTGAGPVIGCSKPLPRRHTDDENETALVINSVKEPCENEIPSITSGPTTPFAGAAAATLQLSPAEQMAATMLAMEAEGVMPGGGGVAAVLFSPSEMYGDVAYGDDVEMDVGESECGRPLAAGAALRQYSERTRNRIVQSGSDMFPW
ncbi:uncharacterized protein TEOVI_000040000 [Trypanosoma equiperdum]|uniref:Uncharacterized protein n=2 Tax=Trypanozoon TaxID=39700 RepID=Q582J5_TRYB2|nr:hypothetical protein Tb927.7.5800 [Trypanosoma brucei brucei TREU927]AAX78836.1 hypothetical protein Tb927.7.5800 [Trypanosoma brucei]AAZ12644.1 hypothetical protein Tb927.7.5800 [Trypanosoma brucei brucei TREU927]SCU67172.1 hypothetical protein, conserved [Trypanosoma equiperdum]